MTFDNLENCYIIAEIGVNHAGSVELAKEMILAAKNAGADAVKFQTFTAEALVSHATPKVKYQESTTDSSESHYDMIKSLEFSREDHLPVIEYCKQLDIDFISTPYDLDSARFLDNLGVNIFKVASADIVDLPLHDFLASTNKNIIISTGMATLSEIEEALSFYKKHDNQKVTLLHCVSNYPCAYDSLNLKVLQTLESTFGYPVGYSDHAIGPIPASASVALGAKVIEKHFTLDKNMVGPDHKASSTPDEFRELVEAIRITERSLGNPIKEVQEEEKQMRQVSRKSLFLSKDIHAGEPLSQEHLTLKRPGTGLYANQASRLIGSKAKIDLQAGHMISHGDFS